MRFLVVVDMQKDFVDGALGTPEAQAIVPAVARKIAAANAAGDAVFVTMDTHSKEYLDTQEGRNLPVPHCIKNTPGWLQDAAIAQEVEKIAPQRKTVLEKPTFGAVQLPQAIGAAVQRWGIPEEIEFVGLCTGICVISNVLLVKAAFPEIPLSVDAACCACVTPASHRTALDAMRLCQVQIKNA